MIGPDFICIGAVKAGTQWLFDQARSHPDCWMTPIKELHYFNYARERRFPLPMFVKHAMERMTRCDTRARSFFRAMMVCEGYGVVPDLYRALFLAKGHCSSGDVSPGYCQLPPEGVAQMVAALPGVKFLFIARDPVARAWSDLCMLERRGTLHRAYIGNEVWLRAYMHEKRMRELSYASGVIKLWASLLPPERFRVFDFGLTQSDPAAQRRAIFDYIGLDPSRAGALPS